MNSELRQTFEQLCETGTPTQVLEAIRADADVNKMSIHHILCRTRPVKEAL